MRVDEDVLTCGGPVGVAAAVRVAVRAVTDAVVGSENGRSERPESDSRAPPRVWWTTKSPPTTGSPR